MPGIYVGVPSLLYPNCVTKLVGKGNITEALAFPIAMPRLPENELSMRLIANKLVPVSATLIIVFHHISLAFVVRAFAILVAKFKERIGFCSSA